MGRNDKSVCRVCGQVFHGIAAGKKAPEHTAGRYSEKCPGSRQGTTIHVP